MSGKPTWVYFLLDGDQDQLHAVKVNIGSVNELSSLFALATDKLRVSAIGDDVHVSRVFSQEGIEIKRMDEIYPDDRLYFTTGEPLQNPPDAPKSPSTQASATNANDGYLYTAGLWTSAIVSTTYGAFSHAMKTHPPQAVVNSFTTFEDAVNAYSQPLVQSTIPYISSSVNWTDQMINQAIVTTTAVTNDFLSTPTGTELKHNVSDYATKAVEAFKAATTGDANGSPSGSPTNGNNGDHTSPRSSQEQQEKYMQHLQQKMGDEWNPALTGWAKATFDHLGAQSQNGEGAGTPPPNGSNNNNSNNNNNNGQGGQPPQ